MVCGYLSQCISPLFCSFVLSVESQLLLLFLVPDLNIWLGFQIFFISIVSLRNLKAKSLGFQISGNGQGFGFCFIKDVFVQLSKSEANAFSMSINLRGLSEVKVCSLTFYEVWFHKNVWFQGIGPCSLLMGKGFGVWKVS